MSKLSKSSRNWIIFAALFVAVLVIALVFAKKRNQQEIQVSTEKAAYRSIVETVAANGKIQPALEVKISPYISGEVVELYAREGNFVKKGDLLAKIDATLYLSAYEQVEASLNSARANMANTKARVAQAEAQFMKATLDKDRNEKLYNQKVISDADWDGIKANYKVNSAEFEAAKETLKATQFQVQNAEASLKEARENLNRTNIYAPADGTISKLNVEVGERVTGASQFSSGTEIMRIANLDNMEVKVEVSENDIPRVKLNDTCLVEVDAYLNKKFKGFVTEIATSANNVNVSVDQVTNFEVKVMLLKESYADLSLTETAIKSPFRPGMSATVDIQTKMVNNVLTVPIQAVTTREDTASSSKRKKTSEEVKPADTPVQEYVFVVENQQSKIRAVKTGIQDNNSIQILEGLTENDEVITGPYRVVSKTLKNNDKVKVVDKSKLFETTKK
ncbi:MAG TPA: efflux RND transporter periplasmic adaptor subunit [Bacteroidales bacterium]|nr:efflux RND transporter periplasmic adaptor subunit [Bacteroidales bacterium]